MVQVPNEQLNGNTTLCDTHDVDTLTNKGVIVPHVPMVSAGDLHALFKDMLDLTINAIRTPPVGGKAATYQKREGAKQVKSFECAMTGADGLLNY